MQPKVLIMASNGFEQDYDRPNAWRYRDYVINSLNQDKPYNQFLREQIAGIRVIRAFVRERRESEPLSHDVLDALWSSDHSDSNSTSAMRFARFRR